MAKSKSAKPQPIKKAAAVKPETKKAESKKHDANKLSTEFDYSQAHERGISIESSDGISVDCAENETE